MAMNASLFEACHREEEVRPQPPIIASFNPTSGAAGSSVTIRGTKFDVNKTKNVLKFGGDKMATVSSVTATELTVIVPAGAVTGKVSVAANGLTGTSAANFIVLPTPAIVSVNPASARKGEIITIKGRNFSRTLSENVVTINGKTATVKSATTTQLTVEVPAKAGDGPVKVTVSGVTLTGSNFDWVETYTLSKLAGGLSGLRGIDVDVAGNIYVSEGIPNRITKITTAGIVSTLGVSVTDPVGIATDVNGNIYVVDNFKVQKISPSGSVSTLANDGGLGVAVNASGDKVYITNADLVKRVADGVATSVTTGSQGLNFAAGLTLDAAGNIYVVSFSDHYIRKITFDAAGAATVSTFAGSSQGYLDNPIGTNAKFDHPEDIVADASGNIYVADGGNKLIRMITPAGAVSTINLVSTNGGSLNHPYGIAIDKDGNLYVADTGNHVIRKIVVE